MQTSRSLRGPVTVVAVLLCLLAALLAGQQAASASPGQVVKVDVTGAVFTCAGGTTYTVTSGTAIAVFHESTDATGGMHVTGTIAPTGVKLASSADNLTYRLAGASWFGGNFGSGGGTATDTEHFQIIGPSGGVVASVSIVSHFTVTAQGVVTVEFEKNTGACTPPED
jgi:hypothetical protein